MRDHPLARRLLTAAVVGLLAIAMLVSEADPAETPTVPFVAGTARRAEVVVKPLGTLVPVALRELMPGDKASVGFAAVTSAPLSAKGFSVTVTSVRDVELTCAEPERAAGDKTCTNRAKGELGSAVVARLTRGTLTSTTRPQCRFTSPMALTSQRSLASLIKTPGRVTTTRLRDGRRMACVAFELTLPLKTTNAVQTDQLRFSLRFSPTSR